MKTLIFLALAMASTSSFAEAKSKAYALTCCLDLCQAKYTRFLELEKTLPRMNAHLNFKSEDGVWDIGVTAYHPLSGDFAKYDNIIVRATNAAKNILLFSGQTIVGRTTENHNSATLQITTDEGDDTRGSAIVDCTLKLEPVE